MLGGRTFGVDFAIEVFVVFVGVDLNGGDCTEAARV